MINRIISFFLALITSFSLAVNFYRPGKRAEFESHYEKAERNMEKYTGVYSSVEDCGGVPTLFVNGEPFPAAAYMTYLEEYNNYSQFANAGYILFSVPVLFAGRWISVTEGLTPFHGGIFDVKGEPDFSSLDESVGRILSACPDAYIFPRVNLSMPLWWIEENPDCLDGTGKRELLCSLEFRETAADMLRQLIDYVNSSPYASHIVGYQIAGGNTEEWFYFDMNAGCCENAVDEFNAYLEKYYPGCGFSGLPDLSLLNGKGTYHKNEHLTAFLEFSSYSVADTICYLSSVAKEATGGNVVVGTFYGYSLEVTSSLQGAHALKTVLACDNIDFICSPNSYIGLRNNDYDWTEMYPAASVRFHGKLCMQECDIRTYLTRLLGDAAPEYDPEGVMNAPIWHPLESKEQSIAMIRKSFSRQLINGNGFWWFDMWGGWYHDERLMVFQKKAFDIYRQHALSGGSPNAGEIALFMDDALFTRIKPTGALASLQNHQLWKAMGFVGAPYRMYMLDDLINLDPAQFRMAIFSSACDWTEDRLNALSSWKSEGRVLSFLGPVICESATGVGLEKYPQSERPVRKITAGQKKAQNDEALYFSTKAGSQTTPDMLVPVQRWKALPGDVIMESDELGPQALLRRYPDYSVYVDTVSVPEPGRIRELLNAAGGQLYTCENDIVYASRTHIAVHAATDGIKRIHIPGKGVLVNEMTGQTLPGNESFVDVSMKMGETLLLRIVSEETD